jgi:catechol 2,3-dioxygenase-like lactoylglutathione lyase family enzyme
MATRFDMIGLFVTDIQRMVLFYRDVVGLAIEWDGAGPYAEFRHEGIRFAMYERAKLPELLGMKPDYPHGVNGTFELALNVGDPKNVDREFERFVRGGAKPIYQPRNEPWKMRSAMVADPEGNMLEIGSDFWQEDHE